MERVDTHAGDASSPHSFIGSAYTNSERAVRNMTHGVRCPKKTGKRKMGRNDNGRTELTNIALANLRRCNQKKKITMNKRRTSSAISILAPSTELSEYRKVVSYNCSRTNGSKQQASIETELHV